jgi:hypothetical protein
MTSLHSYRLSFANTSTTATSSAVTDATQGCLTRCWTSSSFTTQGRTAGPCLWPARGTTTGWRVSYQDRKLAREVKRWAAMMTAGCNLLDIQTTLHLLTHWDHLTQASRNYIAHQLHLLYIAMAKGWPAALYYDQQGTDEFLDVTPDFWASFQPPTRPRMAPREVLHTSRYTTGIQPPTRPIIPTLQQWSSRRQLLKSIYILHLLCPLSVHPHSNYCGEWP